MAMLFGLKNVEATYQRMVSKVFEDLIGKVLDAYIHDTIVKGKNFGDHLQNLKTVFERLQRYRVRINPKKCTFSVKSRMFLGHVVRRTGVKASPIQVQDILKFPKLRKKKEI